MNISQAFAFLAKLFVVYLPFAPPQPPSPLPVEQRCERAGRSSLRISINSLAVSPLAPHTFVTGGSDPFARLYDMRMLRGGSGGGAQVGVAVHPLIHTHTHSYTLIHTHTHFALCNLLRCCRRVSPFMNLGLCLFSWGTQPPGSRHLGSPECTSSVSLVWKVRRRSFTGKLFLESVSEILLDSVRTGQI